MDTMMPMVATAGISHLKVVPTPTSHQLGDGSEKPPAGRIAPKSSAPRMEIR